MFYTKNIKLVGCFHPSMYDLKLLEERFYPYSTRALSFELKHVSQEIMTSVRSLLIRPSFRIRVLSILTILNTIPDIKIAQENFKPTVKLKEHENSP